MILKQYSTVGFINSLIYIYIILNKLQNNFLMISLGLN